MNPQINVKIRLLQNHLTASWLMYHLEKLDITIDKSSLSEILNGHRKGLKADLIIRNAHAILDRYEAVFVQ